MTDLRITHVVNTDRFAGLERYVVDVSNVLAERGHEVRVIGGEEAGMNRLLASAVHWQPGAGASTALAALRTGGRRDVVHSHITKSDFVALAAAPFTRAARVSTRHITAPRGYSGTARRLAPLVRSRLAVEIAVSAWTSAQLEQPSDVILMNGVVPVPDADDAARERTVFVAQRLEREKDTDIALRAWAAAGLGAEGWRLVVAGRGDQHLALEALATELGVDTSVDLVGFLDDPAEQYRTASMLLAPAPTEPCGLTVLEAMAWGLPVVAAGSAGHAETVGTLPGAALFPPKDVDAAAACLRALADDPVARVTYGHRLREAQRERFTIDGHVDGLEAVYRSVTG